MAKNCVCWIKIILWNMSGNILVGFLEYLAFATSWGAKNDLVCQWVPFNLKITLLVHAGSSNKVK
jgi:hypothetical protein